APIDQRAGDGRTTFRLSIREKTIVVWRRVADEHVVAKGRDGAHAALLSSRHRPRSISRRQRNSLKSRRGHSLAGAATEVRALPGLAAGSRYALRIAAPRLSPTRDVRPNHPGTEASGVNDLLPQPGGFEGCIPGREDLTSRDQALLEPED